MGEARDGVAVWRGGCVSDGWRSCRPRIGAVKSAAIHGVVRGPSGVPVAGARVVLVARTSASAGRPSRLTMVATSSRVQPAVDVELEASAVGFTSARQTLPPLATGERRLVDLALEPPASSRRYP